MAVQLQGIDQAKLSQQLGKAEVFLASLRVFGIRRTDHKDCADELSQGPSHAAAAIRAAAFSEVIKAC